MALTPGNRLGPYEVVAQIGVGGMGEVYKATDARLDRTVAIKVLPEHVAANPELKQRFEREAKTLAALSHPHICPVFDVGSQDGIDFLVMEYLEGDTLAARLAKGALPIDQALSIAIQIADALDKAHRAGIVHRDLKPGNIMLTKSGAKLLDFGLAKVTPAVVAASGLSRAPTGVTPLTAQGTIFGTLAYMAPEQIEGQEADARTDIFAFGAVLYEMLTGRKAFEGHTQASLIAAILEREPQPISRAQPLSPPILDRVARKCVAKNPDNRWQTATDLLDELRWVVEASHTASATVSDQTRGQSRRIKIASAVAVALLLTSAALAGVILLHREAASLGTIRLAVFPPENATFSVGRTDRPEFAVSPDGRVLAFSATDAAGRSLLWIQPFDSFVAQPLNETVGATLPFWSPDGRSIGFFAQGKLKKMTVSDGVPETLCDAAAGVGGTWNRDGLILFSPRNGSALFRVSDAGGDATEVTALNPSRQEVSHSWPQFLPDGRHFIFLVQSTVAENNGIFLGSIDDKETRLIAKSDSRAAYASGYLIFGRYGPGTGTLMAQSFDARRLTFTSEPVRVAEQLGGNPVTGAGAFAVSESGVLVYRTARRGGETQLIWLDRHGKPLKSVGDPSIYRTHELSPDDNRIAAHRHDDTNNRGNIWTIEPARDVTTRFTFTDSHDTAPIWSPDGSRIVFSSVRESAVADLYEKAASGAGNEELLLKTSESKRPLDWSRDGRFILFQSVLGNARTGVDLWVLPTFGDRKPTPFLRTPFNERWARFSPDEKWVAYVSDESGREEVYIQPFPPSGGKWQISTTGGTEPRWRGDGGELFYISDTRSGDGKMMAVPIKSTSSPETGAPQELFSVQRALGTDNANRYSVSADGQRFVVNSPQGDVTQEQQIVTLINWTAGLKR